MQRADGGVASWLLLFTATPQSHFVRQLPGRGAFWFTANQKLSPQAGKVAWRSHDERGTARNSQAIFLFPLSRLAPTAPPQAVEPFGFPPTEKSPIGALFIACLFSLILISSRSRCSCRGQTGQRRGHSPRAGSCCRNSRGNSSRSSSRSRGRSPWGRCWSGTW